MLSILISYVQANLDRIALHLAARILRAALVPPAAISSAVGMPGTRPHRTAPGHTLPCLCSRLWRRWPARRDRPSRTGAGDRLILPEPVTEELREVPARSRKPRGN